ncbi:MAG: response regulator [Bacteroidetes bacterium]|nr:response regulator [Bacteroidota bacterium]
MKTNQTTAAQTKVMVVSQNATFTQDVKNTLNENFEVLVSNNASEAFDLLLPEQVQVLVVDQFLNGTTGAEFLQSVNQQFPQVKAVFVAQNTDELNWESLLNDSRPFRVISVPVSLKALQNHVADAAARFHQEFENEQTLEFLNRQNQQMQFLLTQSLLS